MGSSLAVNKRSPSGHYQSQRTPGTSQAVPFVCICMGLAWTPEPLCYRTILVSQLVLYCKDVDMDVSAEVLEVGIGCGLSMKDAWSCDFDRFYQICPIIISTQSAKMSSILKSAASIVPLLDRVLVQRVKAEAKTASGILLPEKNVEKLNTAKVLAIGPGFVDTNGNKILPNVAVGETVLIPQFGGSTIKVGDDEVILFRDSEILAKINE
ncbi:hypothetical protein WICPIJ_005488 [Wickerhamomyces pijperi]|uniref:Uncharacterized protein n=1 Tax=Wickerhamomyces pijperi TaxID=599730 RepID=A0A9P8Q3Y9_WICPI|nr:hypothetical protein WICPIJ_005488 [Wickerhamomyces pijperi]